MKRYNRFNNLTSSFGYNCKVFYEPSMNMVSSKTARHPACFFQESYPALTVLKLNYIPKLSLQVKHVIKESIDVNVMCLTIFCFKICSTSLQRRA